jgi:hypothetical protein
MRLLCSSEAGGDALLFVQGKPALPTDVSGGAEQGLRATKLFAGIRGMEWRGGISLVEATNRRWQDEKAQDIGLAADSRERFPNRTGFFGGRGGAEIGH